MKNHYAKMHCLSCDCDTAIGWSSEKEVSEEDQQDRLPCPMCGAINQFTEITEEEYLQIGESADLMLGDESEIEE
jgi:predicted RNA-binding Zn-ribbon protein involved in translation (DUF1610 family)